MQASFAWRSIVLTGFIFASGAIGAPPLSGDPGFGKQWVRDNPFTLVGQIPGFHLGPVTGPQRYWNTNYTAIDSNGSDQEYHDWATVYGKPVLREVDRSGPLEWDQDFADMVEGYVSNIPTLSGLYLRDEVPPGQVNEAAALAAGIRSISRDYLVWGNLAGDQIVDHPGFASEWITKVKPDVLQYDSYPFAWGGGTNFNYYFERLMLVRNHALNAGIPYWAFLESFSIELSESQMRMNAYSHLAAGYTGLHYFTHGMQDGFSVALLDASGNPTEMYFSAQGINREVAALGKSLKFLGSTGVRFIPATNASTPTGLSNWSQENSPNTNILAISVDGNGTVESGLIGFYSDDASRQYFMLTNLNHAEDMDADSTELSFTIIFENSVNDLFRLNRLTGEPERLSLLNHTLNLTLPGGTGDLFKYNDGDFAGIPGGDADLDGDVDLSDLSTLAANYGINSSGRWGLGDFDLDGDIDLNDLSRLAANYGMGSAQAFADFQMLTQVPEPATLGILLLAGVCMARPSLFKTR